PRVVVAKGRDRARRHLPDDGDAGRAGRGDSRRDCGLRRYGGWRWPGRRSRQPRRSGRMSRPVVAAQRAVSIAAAAQRRWTSLAFVALAQLMVALDATIVSIALPSAQATLHASDADRQ